MTGEAGRKHCRITRVTSYVVGMRWRNCVFAHVETDDGIAGVGEGSLEYQPQAVAAAIDQLAHRYVVGQSAFSIERLFHDMLRNEFMRGPIINSASRDRDGDVGHRRQGARPARL